MLADAHLHLWGFTPEALEAVLERARDAGVTAFFSCGADASDLSTQEREVEIANSHDNIWTGVGAHPLFPAPWTEALAEGLRTLTQKPKVMAIGEIGLDYDRWAKTRPEQLALFRPQVKMAVELGKPLIIMAHGRKAHHETVSILRRSGAARVGGIAHGFDGTVEEMKDWLDLGFHITLALRFLGQSPEGFDALAAAIPWDRLLLETDTHQMQGREPTQVEPKELPRVAQRVAQARRASLEEVASRSTGNLMTLLRR